MKFSITNRRFITTWKYLYQSISFEAFSQNDTKIWKTVFHLLKTMIIRFRNPRKLGACSASWLKHEGRSFEWTAATCRYLEGTFGCVPSTVVASLLALDMSDTTLSLVWFDKVAVMMADVVRVLDIVTRFWLLQLVTRVRVTNTIQFVTTGWKKGIK